MCLSIYDIIDRQKKSNGDNNVSALKKGVEEQGEMGGKGLLEAGGWVERGKEQAPYDNKKQF